MMDLQFLASTTMKAEVIAEFVTSILVYLLVWPCNNFGKDIVLWCDCTRMLRCCKCCRRRCKKKKSTEEGSGGGESSFGNLGWLAAMSMLVVMSSIIVQTIYMSYAREGHTWESNGIVFMIIGVLTGLLVTMLLKWAVWLTGVVCAGGVMYIISIYSDDPGSVDNIIVLVAVFLTLCLIFWMRTCINDVLLSILLTIISSFFIVYGYYYFQQKEFTEYTVAVHDILGASSCWEDTGGCLKRFAISMALIAIKLVTIAATYLISAAQCCCNIHGHPEYDDAEDDESAMKKFIERRQRMKLLRLKKKEEAAELSKKNASVESTTATPIPVSSAPPLSIITTTPAAPLSKQQQQPPSAAVVDSESDDE